MSEDTDVSVFDIIIGKRTYEYFNAQSFVVNACPYPLSEAA